LEKVPSTLFKF